MDEKSIKSIIDVFKTTKNLLGCLGMIILVEKTHQDDDIKQDLDNLTKSNNISSQILNSLISKYEKSYLRQAHHQITSTFVIKLHLYYNTQIFKNQILGG